MVNSSARPLRVGVVGLNARVERTVLPGLAAAPRAHVAAVCSRDRAKAERFAAPYPGCRPFDDYAEMLRCDELDAVFVLTPPELHAEMSLAAIATERHVCCEKPLAASLVEARTMARAARERGVRTAVNFTYRSSPGPRMIARELRDSGIGTLLHVQLEYLQGRGLRLPGPFRDPLPDLGSHALDALIWWTEAADAGAIERIAGVAAPVPSPAADLPCDVPLVWNIVAGLGGGATASLTISRVAAGRGNAVLASLYGRSGALRLEFDVEDVWVWHAKIGDTAFWEARPIPDELRLDYATFPRVHFDRIVGALLGEEAFPSFDDGLRVQELIAAAELAAHEGRTIALPLA